MGTLNGNEIKITYDTKSGKVTFARTDLPLPIQVAFFEGYLILDSCTGQIPNSCEYRMAGTLQGITGLETGWYALEKQ